MSNYSTSWHEVEEGILPNYNRINEWPLQFLRTGLYYRAYGYLDARTTNGLWWSGTAGPATDGRALGTWTGSVYARNNYWRGYGFALRCVKNIFFLKRNVYGIMRERSSMRVDDQFINEVGLAGMPADERSAFMMHAEEELEVRVGRTLSQNLSEAQLSEFDAIDDTNEAQAWLEHNAPTFRSIVKNIFDTFKQELQDERMRILGIEP